MNIWKERAEKSTSQAAKKVCKKVRLQGTWDEAKRKGKKADRTFWDWDSSANKLFKPSLSAYTTYPHGLFSQRAGIGGGAETENRNKAAGWACRRDCRQAAAPQHFPHERKINHQQNGWTEATGRDRNRLTCDCCVLLISPGFISDAAIDLAGHTVHHLNRNKDSGKSRWRCIHLHQLQQLVHR